MPTKTLPNGGPGMAYALGVLFDNLTTKRIENLRTRLAAMDLGPVRLGDPEIPYLCLGMAQAIHDDHLGNCIGSCSANPKEIAPDLFFHAPAIGRTATLSLFLEPNADLQYFQKVCYENWSLHAQGIYPRYHPGVWIPRVILTRHGVLEKGFAAHNYWHPLNGHITDVVVLKLHRGSRWIHAYYPLASASKDGTLWSAFNQSLSSQRYFEAHEILEVLWRQSHDTKTQTAIWIAALFVHWQRGHHPGALKILKKIMDSPRRYDPKFFATLTTWHHWLQQHAPAPSLTPFQRMILIRWARSLDE